MEVSLIAALARDRVIGSDSGGIPWDLPRDKAHFRSYTSGKPILLGRRTFGEMEGWFTDQDPIFVLTRNPKYLPHTAAEVVGSVGDAIGSAIGQNHSELVVAGGGGVFEAALPHATRLVLTWVDAEPDAVGEPIYFPPFDAEAWPVVRSENWPADSENGHGMTLEIRERR